MARVEVAREPGFALEAGDHHLVVGELRAQQLQRHAATVLVAGREDDPHGPFAERLFESVAADGAHACDYHRPIVIRFRVLGPVEPVDLPGGKPRALFARLALEPGRVVPADALVDALHVRGVLHRDVKPSNVLLDGEGTAALADFGLARGADSTRLTADGQLLGTPHYLAPELIEGQEATRESDVYALGCVLYKCLAGEPPFAGRGVAAIGFAHLAEAPPDPRGRRPELSEGVVQALLAALEKDPAARPTSATALARMLHVGRAPSPRS